MQRKGIWRAAAAFAMALSISACGGVAVKPSGPQQQAAPSKPAQPVPTGQVQVAVLAPLTGEYAPIGRQLVNASAIALFENGAVDFELVPFDTRGTPEGAAAAAADAQRQRVDMVIGPLFGPNVAPVQQAMANAQAPILTFTNDSSLAGGNVFVLGVSVEGQVDQLAQALARNGKSRLLVFGPETEYTRRAIAAVRNRPGFGQVQLVRAGTFPPGADFNSISEQVKVLTDYDSRRGEWRAYQSRLVPMVRQADDPPGLLRQEASRYADGSVRRRMLLGMASVYDQHISRGRNQALSEVVARIEGVDAMPADDFDAILLPFGSQNLIAVGSMLDLYNAGMPFSQIVGTDVWTQNDLAREPSFHNAWYSAMDEAALAPFVRSYRANYQEDPEPIAVLGYLAAQVAVQAVSENVRPITGDFIRRPQGFQGLVGTVRFGDGNQMGVPLAVYKVTPQGPQLLEEGPAAPAS